MNELSRLIRLNANAGDGSGGGGGTAVATPPAGGQTLGGVPVDTSLQTKNTGVMDLDAKVKLDGKEYSVKELLASHQRLSEVETELTQAKKAIASLYGPDTPEITTREQFDAQWDSYKTARALAGLSEAQARAEFDKLRDQAGFGEKGGDPDDDDDKKIDIDKHPAIIQAQKLSQATVKRVVEESTRSAIESTKELKVLVDAVRKSGASEEEVAAFTASLDEELRRHLGPALRKRMEAAGGILEDFSWISEEMKGAAAKTVAKFKPFLKVAEELGRATSTVPDFLKGLPEKPVEKPVLQHGNRSKFDADHLAWIKDKLARAAHQVYSQAG